MAYTAPQIGTILLKADRTMYKIGQIAYENMFAEDNEALDYERDIIFIYKKAVEYADDLFLGTEKLDKVVERLAAKISAYDYGELNPIYADAALLNISTVVAGAALNDLSDVTITNLQDNQTIRYNAATGQWINVGPGAAVRNSQAFTATSGQTVFNTSFPFEAGLFDLYLNGVKLNSLSYTTFGEYQITLNDGCSAGDIIDVVIYDPFTTIFPPINSLDDLVDVSLGPLLNNQVLYYNSATGLWQNGTATGGVWGSITGTLSNQTDLQNALNAKYNNPTGTTSQYLRGDGSLATFPSLTGYVPYTGATTNVDLGTHRIIAQNATISSSGSGDTFTLNHSSGSGIGLTITKGGNGEGLYINKTSGSGNAATIIGTINATTLVKSGGTSSQFLKADGSVDSSVYVPTSRELTINGVTFDLSANRSWTVSGGISGSGASGQVSYWDGTTSQAGSNNLFWDNTNGRLGIGTNAPVTQLNATSSFLIGSTLSNANTTAFPLQVNLSNTGSNIGAIWRNASATGYATFRFYNDQNSGVRALELGYSGSSYSGAIVTSGIVGESGFLVTTGNYPLQLGSNNTARAIITGGGNILLNSTTDSGQRLQVQGATLLNGNVTFSSATGMTWDAANSRIGIGTNVPTYPLHIRTSSRFGLAYECTDDTANQNYLFLYRNSATPAANDGIGTILLEGNNSSLVRSTYAYFGGRIITSTAASHSGELYFATTNAGTEADKLVIKPTGNVLIQNGGTFTDGGQRLQVQGTTLLNGNVSINSTLTINTSGQARTISTYHPAGAVGNNIWIGGGGTLSQFTTGQEGSNNTSVGVNALASNTTGTYNVAFGANALVSNSTGQQNNAFGYNTLYSNTTGSFNMGFGINALRNTTTGSNNIGIGAGAGWNTGTNANTTGSNNIFIGASSIGVSATESNRTWIGTSSTTSTWLGGNLLLGSTTNSGERLQVTGTMKVTSNVTFSDCVTYNDTTKSLNVVNSGTPSALRGLAVYQHNDGVNGAAAQFFKSRGSSAIPTNVQTGDLVGAFLFHARVGGVYTSDRALFGACMTSTTGISLYFSAGTTDGSYNPIILAHHTGYVGIGLGGSIITTVTAPTALLDLAASTTARASLRIRSGVAPTTPNDGDIWATTTDILARVNGANYSLIAGAGGGSMAIGGAITSATAGSVLFAGASGVLAQNNANFFWDATNLRLGIGTNAPTANLEINGTYSTNGFPLYVKNTGYFNAYFQGTNAFRQAAFYLENDRGNFTSYGGFMYGGSTSNIGNLFGLTRPDRLFMFSGGTSNVGYVIGTLGNAPLQFGTNGTIIATFFGGGNLALGSTTDSGERLQVTGTAKITGAFYANAGSVLSGLVRITSLLGEAGQSITIEPGASNRLIVLKTFATAQSYIRVNGTVAFSHVAGDVSSMIFDQVFSPTTGTGIYNALKINPTINQTGGANGITRGLYVNPTLTAAADFRAIETSAGNVLFGSGFFWDNTNGRLGIGTNAPTRDIDLVKTSATNGLVGFGARNLNATGEAFLAAYNDVNQYVAFEVFGSNWSVAASRNLATVTASTDGGMAFLLFNNNANADFSIKSSTSLTEKFRLYGATGNLVLQNGGTFTDSGQRLQVTGDAKIVGNLTLGTTPTIRSTTGNIILSSVDVPTRTLTYDTLNNTLTFSSFGTMAFVGARFSDAASSTTYISPDGLNAIGSAKITAYDAAGNVAITCSNNGNRSIALKGLGSLGSVLIGAITTANGTQYNAILRCDSTTQGFMPPRMTTTQKNAIASPTAGLVVYDTTLNKLCVYTTAWETVTSA